MLIALLLRSLVSIFILDVLIRLFMKACSVKKTDSLYHTPSAQRMQVAHKCQIMKEIAKEAVESTLDPLLVVCGFSQRHWPTFI